jgi:hypothetical protein
MAFYNSIDDSKNFVISFSQSPKYDFKIFAKGYAQAGSALSKMLLQKNHFGDYEAYPVVFLYRHAFELYLKGFYYQARLIAGFKICYMDESKSVNKHRLEPLAKTFKEICKILFPDEKDLVSFAEKVLIYAKEFEDIDKDSYSYRYPIKKNGDASTGKNQIINLSAFQSSMDELMEQFDTVSFGFDIEESTSQEIYEIIRDEYDPYA